jgi:hypothetical protein
MHTVYFLHLESLLALWLLLRNPHLLEEYVGAIEDSAGITITRALLAAEGSELRRLNLARCALVRSSNVTQELRLCYARLLEVRVDLAANVIAGVWGSFSQGSPSMMSDAYHRPQPCRHSRLAVRLQLERVQLALQRLPVPHPFSAW